MLPSRRAFPVALLLCAVGSRVEAQVPTLTRDFTLGCAECGGVLQFGSFQEVALASDGSFLVADRDAPMLRLFDPSGKPHWSGGRKGGGPGEYQYVLRAALGADGSLTIADLGGRRLTTLGPDHAVLGTSPFLYFATTAGTDGRGAIVVGAETPTGGLRVYRIVKGESTPVTLPAISSPDGSAAFRQSSVALSPSGVIAVTPHNERYQIVRLDAAGARLPDITRAVERVRRTPTEEAALRARIGRDMGAVRAALEQSTGKTATAAPAMSTADLSFKPHLTVDGLRYDPAGRLWARTMRGDEAHTVFDVFAPAGEFLGSVTLDGEILHFAFGGRWMLTSGEDADGVPQVTRWTVREPR